MHTMESLSLIFIHPLIRLFCNSFSSDHMGTGFNLGFTVTDGNPDTDEAWGRILTLQCSWNKTLNIICGWLWSFENLCCWPRCGLTVARDVKSVFPGPLHAKASSVPLEKQPRVVTQKDLNNWRSHSGSETWPEKNRREGQINQETRKHTETHNSMIVKVMSFGAT